MTAALTLVPLAGGDVARVLESLPRRAGVGQILGPEGKSLVIGRPANLRTWAAGHLGRGRPPRPGVRPPVDLTPIAVGVGYVETTSAFAQRLAFERLMARYVPPSRRRDLKPPAWIHLDPEDRFPRAVVVIGPPPEAGYGPFPGRDAAQKAIAALHKAYALRPCDFSFEPDPALALGLGCVYAQVQTCTAPCLSRIGEDDYRALAARAAAFLGAPRARNAAAEEWLPPWVARSDARGLVIEEGQGGLELYPVRAGAVLEAHARTCAPAELEATAAALAFDVPGRPPDDTPWLLQWLRARRRTGRHVVLGEEEPRGTLARGVR